jgi:RNA polymerase sigma factor (sigma-70 family)
MPDDTELLRRYARDREEAAFAELVRRHVDLVYAAALRRTNGDTHRAADATQQVFVALARHAASLANHPVLAGWLYTATRNATLNLLREETRRQLREQEAFTMHELSSGAGPEADWRQLRPVLDAAMDELDAADREALLARFFQGRPLAEVGATLRVSEDAARKRVDRALEKLRERLTRRGITSTAVALGAVLAAQQNERERADVTVSAGRAELASARTENQRLQGELARAQAALVAAQGELNSPLADLRVLVRAAQQKLIAPMTFLLRMDKGQLPPATVKLFNLNPEEEASVEKALHDALSEADALAMANVLDVQRPTPNRVVIRFNLYPDAGAKVYNQLVAGLTKALGAERQAAVLALMGQQFDLIGFGFGAWERILTLDRLGGEAPNGPPLRYAMADRFQMRVKQVLPSGTQMVPATVMTVPVKSGDRGMIERDFPAVAKLLPADF